MKRIISLLKLVFCWFHKPNEKPLHVYPHENFSYRNGEWYSNYPLSILGSWNGTDDEIVSGVYFHIPNRQALDFYPYPTQIIPINKGDDSTGYMAISYASKKNEVKVLDFYCNPPFTSAIFITELHHGRYTKSTKKIPIMDNPICDEQIKEIFAPYMLLEEAQKCLMPHTH